jgi:hypothetical protein
MHEIEPFYNWLDIYTSEQDINSPFFGKTYQEFYENTIYGYYIHPHWDFMGSETLYIKILFTDYQFKYTIIELIGEWNDTLYNDIMYLKRKVIDALVKKDIKHFILIGENIFNFHGSDDCYYEEWFEDVEDGWITAVNFRDFVTNEMKKYHIDYYINFGGDLDTIPWRTLKPKKLFELIDQMIVRRIG